MKSAVVLVAACAITLTAGCSKLAALAQDKDAPAADAAAPVAATASAATTAAATASAAPTAPAKVAPASTAVVAKNAKAALAIPSPTTDRIPRNRDKDGPCPAGFVEQPGVEQHSTCARACKTDASCHGHTCVDSDVGDGKVCSDIASKGTAASAAKPALKCKPNELDFGDRCAKICSNDPDCPKGQKCGQVNVPNPNGGTSVNFACE